MPKDATKQLTNSAHLSAVPQSNSATQPVVTHSSPHVRTSQPTHLRGKSLVPGAEHRGPWLASCTCAGSALGEPRQHPCTACTLTICSTSPTKQLASAPDSCQSKTCLMKTLSVNAANSVKPIRSARHQVTGDRRWEARAGDSDALRGVLTWCSRLTTASPPQQQLLAMCGR